MKKIEELKRKRDELTKSMPPWKEIIRGTVCKYYLPCGKVGCRCRKKKEFLHGPYYYFSFKDKGKTRMQLLPQNVREKASYCVKQYEKLWENLCEISKINLKLLMTKKPRPLQDNSSARPSADKSSL